MLYLHRAESPGWKYEYCTQMYGGNEIVLVTWFKKQTNKNTNKKIDSLAITLDTFHI